MINNFFFNLALLLKLFLFLLQIFLLILFFLSCVYSLLDFLWLFYFFQYLLTILWLFSSEYLKSSHPFCPTFDLVFSSGCPCVWSSSSSIGFSPTSSPDFLPFLPLPLFIECSPWPYWWSGPGTHPTILIGCWNPRIVFFIQVFLEIFLWQAKKISRGKLE